MYRLEQTKKGNHIMEQTLPPVFDARRSLLKRNNLKYYRLNEARIHRSSWAAMDFVESGDIDDFDLTENPNFKSDPLYLALHEQYELPFSIAESGLVMDLAMAYKKDIADGIVARGGKFTSRDSFDKTRIFGVHHASMDSGLPIDAYRKMTALARTNFIHTYFKKKDQH